MDIWHIIALALLQGLTEFLPISSSAHLILLPQAAGWSDQGLAFDVALHVGSLVAVLAYFRKDLKPLLGGWLAGFMGRSTPEGRLAWAVLFGTLPVGLAGLLLDEAVDTYLRSVWVIAVATLVFGVLLGTADYLGKRARDEYRLTWCDVLIIGAAQAIALVPGVSRSGITMTAGLLVGLERRAAARFSFLLSIPVIVLAGGLETLKLVKQGVGGLDWAALALGAAVSGLSAYVCIRVFIHFLERIGMWPFVVYRMVLGSVLLLMSI